MKVRFIPEDGVETKIMNRYYGNYVIIYFISPIFFVNGKEKVTALIPR